MAKQEKYQRKKFINPLDRRIGRRTGKNILAGKSVRIQDGFENFDDYLSESDADLTRDCLHLKNITEEGSCTGSSQDEGKENEISTANNAPSSMSVTQSMLSQNSQIDPLHRSKVGWYTNRNLGRRTGKDLRANKQIRVDANGIENFDDYLSETDASSFFSQSSHFSSPMSVPRKRKSDAKEENMDTTLTTIDDQAMQESTMEGSVETGCESQVKDETEINNENSMKERSEDTQEENNEHEEENDQQGDDDDQEEDEQEGNEHVEVTVESNLKVEDNDQVDNNVHEDDAQEREQEEDKLEDLDENDKQVDPVQEDDDLEREDNEQADLDENEEQVDNVQDDDTLEREQKDEVEEESQEEVNDKDEAEQYDQASSTEDNDTEACVDAEHASLYQEAPTNKTGTDICKNPCEQHEVNKDNQQQKEKSSMEEKSELEESVEEANTSVEPDVEESASADELHPVVTDGQAKVIEEKSIEADNTDSPGLDINSPTGIDVAGSRSGSITKLEMIAQQTATLNFNRTKKRLSYSALELSEEGKMSRKSRVEHANIELHKDNPVHAKSTADMKKLKVTTEGTSVKVVALNNDEDTASNTSASSFMCLSTRKKLSASVHPHHEEEDICIIEEAKTKVQQPVSRRKTKQITLDNVDFSVQNSKSVTQKDISEQDNISILQKGRKKIKTQSEMKIKQTRESKKTRRKTIHSNISIKDTKDTRGNIKEIVEPEISSHENRQDKHEKGNNSKSYILDIYDLNLESDDDNSVQLGESVKKKSEIKRNETKAKNTSSNKTSNNDRLNTKSSTRKLCRRTSERNIKNKGKTSSGGDDHNMGFQSPQKPKTRSKKNKTINNSFDDDVETNDESPVHSAVKSQNKSLSRHKTKNSKGGKQYKQSGSAQKSHKRGTRLKVKNQIKDARKSSGSQTISSEEDPCNKPSSDTSCSNPHKRRANLSIHKTMNKNTNISSKYKALSDEEHSNCAGKGPQPSVTKSANKSTTHSVRKRVNKRISSTDDNQTESDGMKISPAKKKKVKKDPKSKGASAKKHKVIRSPSISDEDSLLSDDLQAVNSRSVSTHTDQCSTPQPDSIITAPTYFGSGVSFRVSRRSELLETVSSGYVVPDKPVTIEMESSSGLTPCITRPGKRRKSKGRRVTICPDQNTHHDMEHEEQQDTPRIKSFRHSRGMSGTPLPSPTSTPMHLFETTANNSPANESLEEGTNFLAKKLIIPEPAPEGLRRSQRTRLPRLDRHRGELPIFDYSQRDGPRIIGVKPSLEDLKWKKLWAKKRRRRILLSRIRRATRAEQRDKIPSRRLSIHTDIPDDMMEEDNHDVAIINPSTQEEDTIECICKGRACVPVGPHHGSPRKEDPYLISQAINQPLMSSGVVTIEPRAVKPTQLVSQIAVMFHVTYGKLIAKIHETKVLVETGDTFFVPIGNTYSLTNLRADKASLFYCIYKEPEPITEESENNGDQEDSET